jgi:AraC-like DNA-binding protein
MNIYIKDIAPIIISLQGIFFAFILIIDNSSKKIGNRYLSIFLVAISVQFTIITRESLGLSFSFLEPLFFGVPFTYGPLFFLYSKSLIYKSFRFKVNQLYHFIPAFVIVTFLSLTGISHSSVAPLIYVSLLLYLVISIREIISFRRVIKDTQSSMTLKNLFWLQWTIIVFCTTLFLDIVDQFLWSMDLISGISLTHVSLLVLINWMYYKGLKQSQMFLGISKIDQQISLKTDNILHEMRLSDQDKADIECVKEFIDANNVFTDPDLSLNQLAEYVDISPRRLSYLINNFLNQNFMSFVNSYRIDRAKYRLLNPEENGETISEIMYEVGFNSKSSFYTLFRKHTGFTPSEFKNKF